MSELYHIQTINVDPSNIKIEDMVYIMNHIAKGSRILFESQELLENIPFTVNIFDRCANDDYMWIHLRAEHEYVDSVIENQLMRENIDLEIFLKRYVNVPSGILEHNAKKAMLEEIETNLLSKTKDVEPTEKAMAELQDKPIEELVLIYRIAKNENSKWLG